MTVAEMADTLLSDVEPEISAAMRDHLVDLGVTVLLSATLSAITKADKGGYVVHVAGREPITTARVLVGIGKTPRLDGIGLETLGLDPENVVVHDSGRLGGLDGVWAVRDVTGIAPYTHGANAQAAVVASNIAGGARSMRAAVMPRCVYTPPPVAAVGPTLSDSSLATDIVSVRVSYKDIARPTTDELGDGTLIMFANRADGSVVGASGIGQSMDELVSLVTLAVETQSPVSRLQHIVQPLPTLSQLVGHAFQLLAEQVDVANADRLSCIFDADPASTRCQRMTGLQTNEAGRRCFKPEGFGYPPTMRTNPCGNDLLLIDRQRQPSRRQRVDRTKPPPFAMHDTTYQRGCIIVPPGCSADILMQSGNPYGCSHQRGPSNDPHGDLDLRAARFPGSAGWLRTATTRRSILTIGSVLHENDV